LRPQRWNNRQNQLLELVELPVLELKKQEPKQEPKQVPKQELEQELEQGQSLKMFGWFG